MRVRPTIAAHEGACAQRALTRRELSCWQRSWNVLRSTPALVPGDSDTLWCVRAANSLRKSWRFHLTEFANTTCLHSLYGTLRVTDAGYVRLRCHLSLIRICVCDIYTRSRRETINKFCPGAISHGCGQYAARSPTRTPTPGICYDDSANSHAAKSPAAAKSWFVTNSLKSWWL